MQFGDTVRVTNIEPDSIISIGWVGVIVEIFNSPQLAYEVEFCHTDGSTITTIALTPSQIELCNGKEIGNDQDIKA